MRFGHRDGAAGVGAFLLGCLVVGCSSPSSVGSGSGGASGGGRGGSTVAGNGGGAGLGSGTSTGGAPGTGGGIATGTGGSVTGEEDGGAAGTAGAVDAGTDTQPAATDAPALDVAAEAGVGDAGSGGARGDASAVDGVGIGDRPVDGGGSVDSVADGATGGTAPTGPGTWQASVPLTTAARQELGVAAIGTDVYAIGGHSTLVDAFNTATGQWRSVAPLPAALDHCNVAAVGGRIFLVGATEAEKTIPGDVSAFLVYDPTMNRWTKIRPMPAGTERAASGVAVSGSKIYVVGGWKNYGTATPNFSAYDTATDTWEVLPDILPRRDHLVAGAVQGIVYAIGGRNGTIGTPMGRVDAYNIATKQWSARAPMLTARGGTAGVVLFDHIYVFGGEGNPAVGSNGVFAETEVYDPAANSWRALAPMKIPKHGIGAAVVGGKVYFPAGATQQGGNAQVASMEIFIP